ELQLSVTVMAGVRRHEACHDDESAIDQVIWRPLADLAGEALPSVMRKVTRILEDNDLFKHIELQR
ncbi:MAG: hypothetical protein ACPGYQ_06045, partial [Candidatus Puniceispirillales bacterium]